MQADNAKQGSGLKKILGWTFATIAAVPVTKMVENYFDVSFFSSMFAAVGAWVSSVVSSLGQTIPVQLWLFWGAGIVVALAVAFGIWSFLDKRLEVGLAKTEEQKAFLKAREANAKFNAVDATLNATMKELNAAKLELDAARSELNAAQAKIADLQTPKVQPLNEHQRRALAAIAYYDNSGEKCYVTDLRRRLEFTMIQAEGAVDVLVKRKLVRDNYVGGYRVVSLSPDGREYVLHPDFDMSYLPL